MSSPKKSILILLTGFAISFGIVFFPMVFLKFNESKARERWMERGGSCTCRFYLMVEDCSKCESECQSSNSSIKTRCSPMPEGVAADCYCKNVTENFTNRSDCISECHRLGYEFDSFAPYEREGAEEEEEECSTEGGDECCYDHDCPGGDKYCKGGKEDQVLTPPVRGGYTCVPKLTGGQDCGRNGHCLSKDCIRGKCRGASTTGAKKLDEGCNNTSECTGQGCEENICYCKFIVGAAGAEGGNYVCQKKLPGGAPCDKAEECRSGKCEAVGQPTKSCTGGGSDLGESCIYGYDCNVGQCTEGKCYCRAPGGMGLGTCHLKLGDGEECNNNSECASGKCEPVEAGSLLKECKKAEEPGPTREPPKERGIFTRGLSDGCVTVGTCGTCDILVVVNNIIGFALQIVGGLAVLALVISGVLYITSQGNPEQTQHAKMAATAAVIGTIIVLTTWLIITTILNTLGYNVGSWYAPSC